MGQGQRDGYGQFGHTNKKEVSVTCITHSLLSQFSVSQLLHVFPFQNFLFAQTSPPNPPPPHCIIANCKAFPYFTVVVKLINGCLEDLWVFRFEEQYHHIKV